MNVRIDPDLFKKLKKLDTRVRKKFKEKILDFQNNPNDPQLRNHKLRSPYEGYRSIDINNDYRALYIEKYEGDEVLACFEEIGTHEELYGN